MAPFSYFDLKRNIDINLMDLKIDLRRLESMVGELKMYPHKLMDGLNAQRPIDFPKFVEVVQTEDHFDLMEEGTFRCFRIRR